MKAAVLEAYHKPLVVRDIELPPPGPRRGHVEVKACGLCLTDIHISEGRFRRSNLPLIPGHEFAGVVARIGEGVTDWKVGDRVTVCVDVNCGHCEFCLRGELNRCSRAEAHRLRTRWRHGGNGQRAGRQPRKDRRQRDLREGSRHSGRCGIDVSRSQDRGRRRGRIEGRHSRCRRSRHPGREDRAHAGRARHLHRSRRPQARTRPRVRRRACRSIPRARALSRRLVIAWAATMSSSTMSGIKETVFEAVQACRNGGKVVAMGYVDPSWRSPPMK